MSTVRVAGASARGDGPTGPSIRAWGFRALGNAEGAGEHGRIGAASRVAHPWAARRALRRQVEAELIGLGRDGGGLPEWWGPSWERGVEGTLPAASLIDELAATHHGVRTLHGLALAGNDVVVDHVVLGPGGVVVAGTESCSGRVRSDGVRLRVRGRDRSAIVDLALWRTEVVRQTLQQHGMGSLPVHGVVHWDHVEALGKRPVCLRGVPLLSAGATVALAAAGRAISPLMVERAATLLDRTGRPN